MDKKELLELIKTGEGYTIEFKESLNGTLGKEICAFANSSGGKIILGVADNGSVKGYTLSNADSSRIQDVARNMDPSFSVTIEQVDDFVVIYVPEGKEKPYTVNGHFYLRYGSNSQQLRRDEIRSLFQRENLVRFDRKANQDFDLKNDFDKAKFKSFITKANIDTSLSQDHILRNLGLITEDKLNNTGVLFFSHRISKFFLNSVIGCVLYEGTTKTKILDKSEFDADFVSNFNNAVIFAQRNLRTEYIIKKIEREEKPEVPEEVLRELIINAMTHRDYFCEGRVLVEIFSDRVEISNPGGLLFKKSDFGKTSLSRNPLFVDMVHRLRLVERVGSGISRVKDILGKKVSFDISEEWFRVRINRGAEAGTKVGSKVGTKVGSKLTENQVKILELISDNPHITKKEMLDHLDIGKTAIDNNISKLKSLNLIKRVGSDKSGHWEVTK